MASGWIEQRSKQKNHYTIRIRETDKATGKRKVVLTMSVVGPKVRAEALLKEKLAEYELGLAQTQTTVTMADLCKNWLDVCDARLAASTVAGYETAVRKHIIPNLGRMKLSELQPLHLQRLYAKLLKQGLSPRTVQWIHTICGASLKQAVRWGLLNRNPADMVDAPRPERKQMRVLDLADLPDFLRLMGKCPHGDVAKLALWTGLRRGELLALTWDNVDLVGRRIYVRQNTVRVHRESIVKGPKTASSRRMVALPSDAVALLARLRLMSAGTLVFQRDGKPIMPSTVTSAFRYTLSSTRFAGLRFHDLRHTHATLFLQAGGNSKVLQERLGHGSHSTTMDIYAHVIPDMQQEGVERFERLVERGYQIAPKYLPESQDGDDDDPIKPA